MNHFRATAIAAAFGALLLTACGSDTEDANDDTPTEDATDATSESGVTTVDILDFTFEPASITVPAGTEITFTNSDSAAHTATDRAGNFDTGNIDGGAEGSFVVDAAPGEYTYFCSYHPFMEATIVVE